MAAAPLTPGTFVPPLDDVLLTLQYHGYKDPATGKPYTLVPIYKCVRIGYIPRYLLAQAISLNVLTLLLCAENL
jgi:hypothetical protein